jgi:hypothetical protein
VTSIAKAGFIVKDPRALHSRAGRQQKLADGSTRALTTGCCWPSTHNVAVFWRHTDRGAEVAGETGRARAEQISLIANPKQSDRAARVLKFSNFRRKLDFALKWKLQLK